MERRDESDPVAEFLGGLLVFLVIGAVIFAIFSIASCSGGSRSYRGLGGDPNPTEQYADPCSTFERRCDEGTNPGDVVPDRNGELPDR